MLKVLPNGYVSCAGALDVVGMTLFNQEWSMSRDEVALALFPPDASAPLEEFAAHVDAIRRHVKYLRESAFNSLRSNLETGNCSAVAYDEATGDIEPIARTTWRRRDAFDVLQQGTLPQGSSPNEDIGRLPILIRFDDGWLKQAAALHEKLKREDATASSATATATQIPVTRAARRRGARIQKSDRIKAEMRKMDRAELDAMLEKHMADRFGASRSTCSKARTEVLAELPA